MGHNCLVNLFHLDPARNGGASRVAREVCRMLAGLARTRQLRVTFAVGWRYAPQFPAWIDYSQAEVIPCLPELGLTPLLRQLQPEVLISPLAGSAPFDHLAHGERTRHVVRITEILLLDHPELLTSAEIVFHKKAYAALRHATRVVVDSEYVRQRLINHMELAPGQVVTIRLAGDCPVHSNPVNLALNPPSPYVLYPANGWPHKRHALLLQTMERVWQTRPELKLVLAGSFEPAFLPRLAQQYGCPPGRLIEVGHVADDRRLAALYQGAEALLFTSQCEGFGMPLLEAMANRCPVICAPLAAIPEVVGEAAVYVHSDDPQAWAEALLVTLPPRRESLVAKGLARAGLFSWERTRREWLETLIEAGVELSPPQQEADLPDLSGSGEGNLTGLNAPSHVVNQELAVWANEYARLRAEAEAKEAEIQALAAAAHQRADELIAKEAAIQALHTELAAREAVIRELVSLCRTHAAPFPAPD